MTDGDEPLYCTLCGAEDWSCGHNPHLGPTAWFVRKPYCETCGVIPGVEPGASLRKWACRSSGGPCQFCTTHEEIDVP